MKSTFKKGLRTVAVTLCISALAVQGFLVLGEETTEPTNTRMIEESKTDNTSGDVMLAAMSEEGPATDDVTDQGSLGTAVEAATEGVSDAPTAPTVTDVSTDTPTEVPTEIPTEAPTEVPVEPSTEVSTEVSTEQDSQSEGQTDQTATTTPDQSTEGKTTTKATDKTTASTKETTKASKETTKSKEESTTKKSNKKDDKKETTKAEKETTKKTDKKDDKEKETVKAVEKKPGTISRAIVDVVSDGIMVEWSKSANKVDGYNIYRSTAGGEFKWVAKTTSQSYKDKDYTKGVSYRYRVQAYKTINDKEYFSNAATTGTICIQSTPKADYVKQATIQMAINVDSEGYLYPLPAWYPITADFYETAYHTIPHNGTDIGAPLGTPIYAITDGTVVIANRSASRGNQVVIQHSTDAYWSRYQHMNTIYVQEGDTVKKGQVIGTVGSTGNSTGPHLHIELGMNHNYNSITSVVDGGSLLDAMLYLPNSAAEVAEQQQGKYSNIFFDNEGILTATRNTVVKTMVANMKKKEAEEASGKGSAEAKFIPLGVTSPVYVFEMQSTLLGFDFDNAKTIYDIKLRIFK